MENYRIIEPQGIEEIPDYFVEQGSAIRELELRMWHIIGKNLVGIENLAEIARDMKKHTTEFKSAVEFYKKYPNFEDFPFDKATSWSKVKEELGAGEKRPRKSLKKIIEEHKKVYEAEVNYSSFARRDFIKGKLAEDLELLEEA